MAPPSSSSSSSSSSFDDSDWEFTNIDENDSVSDAEWVITGDDIYYVSGHSVAGVIFPFNKKPSIISFQSNSSSSSLITTSVPPLFPVSASSKGLVLSRGPWSSYLVFNPSTGAHTFLPKPPGPHKSGSVLALTQSGSTYHVICGLAGTCNDSYTLSIFSSTMGT